MVRWWGVSNCWIGLGDLSGDLFGALMAKLLIIKIKGN